MVAVATLLPALLMVNDLFMLHSTVLPRLLGVPKGAVLLALVAVALAWAATFALRLAGRVRTVESEGSRLPP